MLQAIMTVVTMKKTEFEKCRWWRKVRKWWEHAKIHLLTPCMSTASQVWTIIITTQEGRHSLVHPWSADLKAGVFVLYCMGTLRWSLGETWRGTSPSSHIKVGSGGRLS